ncbi:MAG TPA: GerMN domain-containing protein [Acidobacteriota bacterium]|nr:GerMN domain-containing protein [Acidobacteriota bacterium]
MNRPIVIGILLFVIVFGGFVFLVKKRQYTPPKTAAVPATTGTTTSKSNEPPANQRRINVKLYFSTPGSGMLQAEDRFVVYHDTLHDQAFEVLKELTVGPKADLVKTLPDGTEARDLFITKDGVAYADFSGALSEKHQGGSLAEMNTVFSIVNSLTLNFPEIKRVQILIEDHAVDTLNGHMDLSRPLGPDPTLIASAPRQQKK